MHRLKPQPSTAIAVLALFVALGGTSYAVGSQISGSQLANRSVPGSKLVKHTVTAAELNPNKLPAVQFSKNASLAQNALTVAGNSFTDIYVSSGSQTGAGLFNSLTSTLEGLALSMTCPAGAVVINATTTVPGSSIGISEVGTGTAPTFVGLQGNFTPGVPLSSKSTTPSEVTFSYTQPSEAIVTGSFTVANNGGVCAAFGFAVSN